MTDTPEPGDWEETAREVRGDARQHQEALDQVLCFLNWKAFDQVILCFLLSFIQPPPLSFMYQAFPVEARNARSAKLHVVSFTVPNILGFFFSKGGPISKILQRIKSFLI